MSRQGAPGRVTSILVGYALVHSLLASRQAKEAARRWFGARYRNGLYRVAFNLHAVLLFAVAAAAFQRLPDRTLYRIPLPWSLPMWAGQAAGLGLMAWAARAVGVPAMTGLGPFAELVNGQAPLPEPEAQGPPPRPDGELRVEGPFPFTRHPANWGPLLVVLLFPHMTVNRATLAAVSVVYLILGSVHEEYRLHASYGSAYDHYRRRAPFLIGRIRKPAPHTSIERGLSAAQSPHATYPTTPRQVRT